MSLSALTKALEGRSPQELRPAWAALEVPFDLVIVGGGVHGAGIARDAALRGLRVLIVEQGDWGCGTSSRSSKLFHGGLRYLEQGRLGLVRQSLRERDLHLRLMPEHVKPLRFQVCLPGEPWWVRLKFRLGVSLYDALTLGASRARAWSAVPSYQDAVTQDARFVWELIRDARHHGAVALNYCEWQGWVPGENGHLAGANLRDRLSGQTTQVKATWFVNAAGAWAGELDPQCRLRLTRGTHVVLDGSPQDGEARLFLSPRDKRVLFIIPYENEGSLLGTTDVDSEDPVRDPSPASEELHYLREAFTTVFPEFAHWKARGWFSGLRAMVREPGRPSQVSREERITRSGNLWSVLGGKYTGYRAVAQKIVEEITGSRASGDRSTEQAPLMEPDSSMPSIPRGFAREDAVLLEDLFYRRTFWGYSGGVTEERAGEAGRQYAKRWGLTPKEGLRAAQTLLRNAENRDRVLDFWS